jgi:glycosyltransferase involved in cell wall biosynthesis
MIQKPYFSVVIPTFNRAQRTATAVESVLAQTYADFEVIVVDDGSTDGTRDAIERCAAQGHTLGKQVHYIYQPNQGQSVARNRGIAEAKGDWIAFLDSDDLWLPDKLAWQAQAIEQFGGECGACITDARLVSNQSAETTAFQAGARHYEHTLGVVPNERKLLAKSFGGSWVQTLAARATLVREIGGFDPDQHFAEDYDFLFRLSLVARYCYANLPLAQIDRGITPDSAAVRPWEKVEVRLQARQYMYEKWLRLSAELPADIRAAVTQNLRAIHSMWANLYLERGRYPEASQALSRAIEYQLTPQLAIKWLLTRIAPTVARRLTPTTQPYLSAV